MGIYCKGRVKGKSGEVESEPTVSFEVLEKLGAVINIRKKEIIFEK